jgi:hypothetical protein
MNVTINRLDPNVPDPVESRRRAAGRLVRIAYATAVFGVSVSSSSISARRSSFSEVPAPFRPRGTSCHFRIPCRSPR